MKKFGTPIGAGPGSANENVGFDGAGMPPPARSGLWLVPLLFPWRVDGAPDGAVEWREPEPVLCVERGWGLTAPVRWGAPADGEVVVVVFGFVGDGVLWVVVVVVGLGLGCEVVVVGDGADVVVGDGVHDSLVEATGPVTGSPTEETGVPGGTLTVKVSF